MNQKDYYRQLNFATMSDTQMHCHTDEELRASIADSISDQCMYAEDEEVPHTDMGECHTQCIVTPRRSFEAARNYPHKKVAVLNFANNHSIGGSPYYAGAQEESLCRCSTLYPCLKAMKVPFYDKHAIDFEMHRLDAMGNDDMIYTPGVVVFKSDESAPQMLPREEWYRVDILTSAAPIIHGFLPDDYESIIRSRLQRVLDVAALNGNEVLILGAWGCGAFHNPPQIVAKVFHELLPSYNFETVEFAIGGMSGENYTTFKNEFEV